MQPERSSRLWYNFSYLGIIQVSNFILSLLVIPYVISVVGAEGFGVIAVAQVLLFYLSVITDYGFNRTAIRDIALFKSSAEKMSRVFSTVLVAKFLLTVFSFFILLALVFTVPIFRNHWEVYLLGFSFVVGQLLLFNWFFQGLEKMKYMAIASFFSRLIFVVLVFIFLKRKDQPGLYLFFMGIGNILAGLASIAVAKYKYSLQFIFPSRSDLLYELKEGWSVTVSNLSMTTIQYIGIFILRLFTNDLVVGYYSIAEKIYFAMKLMLDVFSQVAYPRVCILVQQGMESVKTFFRQVYIPFLLMVLLGVSIIFIFSPWVIEFFAGHPDSFITLLLRLLCVAVIIVCLNIPACLILLAGDHKKSYFRIFTTGMIVCIIANFIFAPLWEAKGTVLSVLITELFITAGLYLEVYRLYRSPVGIIPGNKSV